MKLKILQAEAAAEAPWYAEGLKFTCSQCGNCCTGGPGFVWVSEVELARLGEHLKLTVEEVIERFGRRVGGRVSLKERRTPQGMYDCVFLREVKTGSGAGARVKKICSVYPVRPLQCRTWPFWDGVLASRRNWEAAGKRCHGINCGTREFSREEIEKLRDAKDWPERPPGSGE